MPFAKDILLVMPQHRAAPLLKQLRSCGANVQWVTTRQAARQLLEAGEPVQLVLTDTILPDGDWRQVLDDVAESSTQAELIVCARQPNRHFYCEVIQNGAYDLIAEPYDPHHTRRVIDAAAARAEMRRLGAA